MPLTAYILVAGISLGVVAAGSFAAIQRYWNTPKSPEGTAALLIKAQSQPEDAVVSAHYSTDVALSFYYPEENVYIKPRMDGSRVIFSDLSVETTAPDELPNPALEYDLDNIRSRPRIWLLTRPGLNQSVTLLIVAGCNRLSAWYFPPFQVELLANCTE